MLPSWYENGTLIDLGSHRLWYACAGHGAPTVLFDAGLSCTAAAWDALLPTVQQWTCCWTLDRAGLGRSDRGPLPRSSQQIVDELAHLLRAVALPPPYLLVGHSFGGMNMQLFAAQHPEQVTGLVLVDSPHPDFNHRMAALLPDGVWERYLQQWNSEGVDLAASFAQLQEAWPTVPTIILSAEQHSYPEGWPSVALEQTRQALQRDLTRRLPRSQQRVIAGSGHTIHTERPDAVIAAIRELLVSCH